VRYRTREFVPALSFVVADTEWLVRDATSSNRLVLDRRRRTAQPGSEVPPRAFLTFSRISEVYDPRRRTEPLVVADLYAWMRRHPDLRVGRRAQVTVGGVPGESFHVTVRFTHPAIADPACRPAPIVCTAIAPDLSLPDGTRLRAIVLRTEPDPLVIALSGQTQRDLQAVERPAAPVLRSLRIGVR
jgi:hypothetical protein